MKTLILAATAFTVLLGASAEAKSEKGCRAKGTCEPGIVQACAAQWREFKAKAATDSEVARVKAGWIPFWSACAKEAKVARTVAP